MSGLLEQRIVHLIAAGAPFTADDVTDNGRITTGNHDPNASQNSIGTMFRSHRKAGHIVPIGVASSRAPRRKGGMIRQWQPTSSGIDWATHAKGAP